MTDVPIEMQTSNIGSLPQDWFNKFYRSFRGVLTKPTPKLKDNTEMKAHIIYPTTK